MGNPSIIVFTRDLRVRDNPALVEAISSRRPLLALFVIDDFIVNSKNLSLNRLAFLIDSLRDLDSSLRKIGAKLVIRQGKWIKEVTSAAKEIKAEQIYISDDFSLFAKKRLVALRHSGELNGFKVFTHSGVSIVKPGLLSPADGREYKIFTPYYRRWLEAAWREPTEAPRAIQGLNLDDMSKKILDGFSLQECSPLIPKGGESEGVSNFNNWLSKENRNYQHAQNDLQSDGTSRISPYLHFGCLSPLEVALQALESNDDAFVRQLCWRDFFLQILNSRPEVSNNDYRDRNHLWNKSPETLNCWKEGKTGFPLVDAGMRQLKVEGFMHNRARMVVSSFLTKDLYLDWRLGAEHFMKYLVDGDIASNQLNWQWVAGTGTDSNPNRIFNPTRQSERFDPKGNYIRKWVPELKDLPPKEIHDPDLATREKNNYPKPIVDHSEAILIYKSKVSTK